MTKRDSLIRQLKKDMNLNDTEMKIFEKTENKLEELDRSL